MDPRVYIGYAQVRDKNGNRVGEKVNFDKPDDAIQFIAAKGNSVAPYNKIKALFIPTRTDNWKNLAKDLFLPTFFNQALCIKNVALRILAALGAVFLDLITLLPRLCVVPVKYGYDKTQKPHPYNPQLEDRCSQLEIEIAQRGKPIPGKSTRTMCENTMQTTSCWVRTKALPEDKKLPKTQVNYNLVTHGIGSNGWEVKSTSTGKTVTCNTLSELKKELANI